MLNKFLTNKSLIIMVLRIIVPILVLFSAVILLYYASDFSRSVAAFWDFPSFLVIVVYPYLYIAGCYGVNAINKAYKTAYTNNAPIKDMKSAVKILKKLRAAICFFGILNSSIYLIAECLQTNVSDAGVNINIAMALLSIFYIVFFNLLLVYPFLNKIDNDMNEDTKTT